MAIYSFNHRPISRTSTHADAAGSAVKYMTRGSAASIVIGTAAGLTPSSWNSYALGLRANARVGDRFIVAIPMELSGQNARVRLVKSFVADLLGPENVEKARWVAAIHDMGDDAGNPHAHMLVCDRSEETGRRIWGASERGSTQRARESWERACNSALEAVHSEARVDCRSFGAQGRLRVPTRHVGPKRGPQSIRAQEWNARAQALNAESDILDLDFRKQREVLLREIELQQSVIDREVSRYSRGSAVSRLEQSWTYTQLRNATVQAKEVSRSAQDAQRSTSVEAETGTTYPPIARETKTEPIAMSARVIAYIDNAARAATLWSSGNPKVTNVLVENTHVLYGSQFASIDGAMKKVEYANTIARKILNAAESESIDGLARQITMRTGRPDHPYILEIAKAAAALAMIDQLLERGLDEQHASHLYSPIAALGSGTTELVQISHVFANSQAELARERLASRSLSVRSHDAGSGGRVRRPPRF